MNALFAEEIRPHHRMRDLVLTLVSDADLEFDLPGWNPTLGGLLLEMGEVQGVYTHSFETLELDWNHRRLPPPDRLTVSDLRSWFADHDEAMDHALSRFSEEELHEERIDRGHGFIASPFTQHEIYREAVYIFYGKLSAYLKALEIDPGEEWAAWVG